VAVEPQRTLDGLANGGFVVDDEDAHRGAGWRENLRGG
jgi:hypothetical protein